MRWLNTSVRYGGLSSGLHWLMLLLIAAAYATMEFKSSFPKGSSAREAMAAAHYLLGLCVFFLVWPRLLARVAGTAPAIRPPLPAWQAAAATATHWVLYALMIGLPLLGWAALSAKGDSVPFFGIELPGLVEKSARLAKQLKHLHETVATAGYYLIGLHVAAALYHHYARRDNTLARMWPSGVRDAPAHNRMSRYEDS